MSSLQCGPTVTTIQVQDPARHDCLTLQILRRVVQKRIVTPEDRSLAHAFFQKNDGELGGCAVDDADELGSQAGFPQAFKLRFSQIVISDRSDVAR